MISDNQMDEFFNSRLVGYPSTVPDDMWDRIVEKKKKDRMIWWFLFGLLTMGILALGLTGGYLLLNQKSIAEGAMNDKAIINQSPFKADTIKTRLSKLPTLQDQAYLTQTDSTNKWVNQKMGNRKNHVENLEHAKMNTSEHITSSRFENTNKHFSKPGDSIAVIENKSGHKNDSLDKKPLVKMPVADSSRNKDLKKTEPEKKLHGGKWFLDLYASPDYPIISPQEYNLSKLSYTIGIKLNRSLGKHFSVKTGIQYSEVNFTGADSIGGGAFGLILLDLPVLAGYSLGKNENLRTTINGGLIFNLYTWWQGAQYMPELFKSNTGLSFYLGVNFERRINDKFSLFGEPYYRYQLTPMTVGSVGFLKFIDVVGISIGGRYYFKK
ncbi:MAG TPA: hypothetical protein VII28_02520 [Puia sp.]